MPEISFEEDVQKMRYWQRTFFASKIGTPQRKEALDESRHYERLVDDHLKRLISARQVVVAPGLFTEE